MLGGLGGSLMTIPELVHQEVMWHLATYRNIKAMDPFAQYLLKTSSDPLLQATARWMRREALRQCLQAHREQPKMNEHLARKPVKEGGTWRQMALLHPYFAEEMRQRHKTTWNNKDFIGSVKEANPKLFPNANEIARQSQNHDERHDNRDRAVRGVDAGVDSGRNPRHRLGFENSG